MPHRPVNPLCEGRLRRRRGCSGAAGVKPVRRRSRGSRCARGVPAGDADDDVAAAHDARAMMGLLRRLLEHNLAALLGITRGRRDTRLPEAPASTGAGRPNEDSGPVIVARFIGLPAFTGSRVRLAGRLRSDRSTGGGGQEAGVAGPLARPPHRRRRPDFLAQPRVGPYRGCGAWRGSRASVNSV